jgi:polysaccharide pyruvyl transferase WcaK-like protein
MKSNIKKLALLLVAQLFKLIRALKVKSKTVVIGPPFPNHINIGDRGLVLGALTHLNQNTPDLILVQMTDSEVQKFPEYPDIQITAKYVGIFQKHKDLVETLKWLWFLTSVKDLFLIGADSVDFYYNRSASEAKLFAANLSGMLGINTRVMSFSINEVSPQLYKTFSELSNNVKLIARDPVSFSRLVEKKVQRISSSADLSFLFSSSKVREDNNLQSFLSSNSGKIIGLSFNNLLFDEKSDNSAKYSLYAEALTSLATNSGNKLLFIPNNITDSPIFSKALASRINDAVPETAYYTEYLGDPAELKALMANCRYYFSTTLHMALFPISVGVPTSSFPYAGKFEGPMSFFDSEDCLLYLQTLPQDADELATLFREHLDSGDVRRAKIQDNISEVIELARKNFY